MSRLTELLRRARKADPQLGADLDHEIAALTKRRTFGLVFEQHQPEAVELPGRAVRRGDKVRTLRPRGEIKAGDQRLWWVSRIERTDGKRLAHLVEIDVEEPETQTVAADDLVMVAEFRDRIYPGLVETGRVERGDDKPFHTVINAENYHAMEMLTYTHGHSVDAIYIDPPYNTGAKDWKYNNNYVESDDDYRHSKWLAMMERRLRIARELLNPEDSVLIVTIDEKEYLRLGLLLEQTFPEARTQMVTSVVNVRAVARQNEFSRTAEFIYFVMLGRAGARPQSLGPEWTIGGGAKKTVRGKLHWQPLRRLGLTGAVKRSDRPNLFYPIFVRTDGTGIHSVGQPIGLQEDVDHAAPPGCVAVWPIRANGEDGYWQIGAERIMDFVEKGYVRAPRPVTGSIAYLKAGERKKVEEGEYEITGRAGDGSILAEAGESKGTVKILPGDTWVLPSHDAGVHGTRLVTTLLPGRRFPFPKSLYAVEDALRFFVKGKPDAVVLDFFSGSGTTAHALMRLNKQDGGRRQCISVTNNEVSAGEQKRLSEQGLRPGDAEWEALGICDHITKPRITAAITGLTPEGEPIKGDYKFTDEFPMADGFAENAVFFTLTYEAPLSVRHNRAFERIALMLWLRAGSRGRIIADLGEDGWDVADSYAVLENLDRTDEFIAALEGAAEVNLAYIVTDDDSAFQMVCRELPGSVVPVRLYESYLHNFEIGRTV